MGWSLGYDTKWNRDIGYGVPAWCDHPDCNEEIDRGLGYVCGGEPYGGERGCGLYFCGVHLERLPQLCERCAPRIRKPFTPKPEHPDWVEHKLTDESWRQWRDENPKGVEELREQLGGETSSVPNGTENQPVSRINPNPDIEFMPLYLPIQTMIPDFGIKETERESGATGQMGA